MRFALLSLALLAGAAQAQDPAARARDEGRFVRALTAHYLDDDSTAAQLLDEVLESRPGDPAVLDARAEVALALGRPADALFFAERAAERAPERAAAHLRLGEALRAAGQAGAAVEALETARRLAPTDPAPLVALAGLHAERGRADAERGALEALVAVGDTPAARLRLSVLYEEAGDLDGARAAARAAARLAPAEPAVRRRLDALAGPTAEPPSAAPAASGTPGAGAADGVALHAAGRYAEAADALLALLDDDPRRLDAWALALDALAQTTDPRAGAVADDALLLFPTVPSVLAPAAEAYLAAGRGADAAAAAQRGIEALAALDPDEAEPLRARLERTLDAAGG
jgi:predicted Zn-dependent protease